MSTTLLDLVLVLLLLLLPWIVGSFSRNRHLTIASPAALASRLVSCNRNLLVAHLLSSRVVNR